MPVLCLAAGPPSVAVVTDGDSLRSLVRAPGRGLEGWGMRLLDGG